MTGKQHDPIASVLLDLLFPPRCSFCGEILPFGQRQICAECAKNLPYIEPDKILRKIGNHTCAVTFYYEGAIRTGIHTMKFLKHSTCAKSFAPYLVRTVSEVFSGEFDTVTFVPISFQRRMKRGFDQTYLLARHACALWDVRLAKTLYKVRNNPPQSTVKTAQERRRNVHNVFRIRPGASIAGRRFLLIDDITTSGSTLAVCAELLMNAGAASVVCAAFAGGHR